jgi:predicted 2-oxoglutarate/Fe(II)-dependent dioxygenase YbiX
MLLFPQFKNDDYGVQQLGSIDHDQCNEIIKLQETAERHISKINDGDSVIIDQHRNCDIYLPKNELTNQIIGNAGIIANKKYGYDIFGIIEEPQILEYAEEQHYDWHIDIGINQSSSRKISVSVILNDQYEGGEMSFFTNKEYKFSFSKGTIIAFPSFIPHRVNPVTSGKRVALVGWIAGTPFR